MNKERIREAIRVMTDVVENSKPFDLSTWFEKRGSPLDCGTAACFAGWLTRDPYFQAIGFKPSITGTRPVFGIRYEYDALAEMLDIPFKIAVWVASPDYYEDPDARTAGDVIYRLEDLLI